ncbi:hypothetical protein QQ045_022594 [Rhodiola kirilowii]
MAAVNVASPRVTMSGLDRASHSNGKGTLDYGEFLAVSLHIKKIANDEHIHRAFSYFDKDMNGFIEPEELRNALMEDGAEDCTDIANDIYFKTIYDENSKQVLTGERPRVIIQEEDSTI